MMTAGFPKPDRSSAEVPSYDLNCFLHLHVAGALGISEKDLRPLLVQIIAADVRNPMTVWQQDSLIERYSKMLDLDLASIFTNLVRDYGLTPFDPTLLRFSPNTVKIPPLTVPLLPVARTGDTVTIASYIPNLDLLLQKNEFQVLNHFWGAPQLTSVWCEPEHLRLVLNRLTENLELSPSNIELTSKISNGGTSWINLDEVSPSEKVNHWFSPTLQRRYLACPVYCGPTGRA